MGVFIYLKKKYKDMAGIKGTKQNEFVEKTIVLTTGLANFKVIAINPNAAEIRTLNNIKPDVEVKEPQYIDLDLQKDGNLQNKIVFHVRGTNIVGQPDGTAKTETVNGKIEFLVAPKVRLSEAGNKQLIDKKGNQNWGTIEKLQATILEEEINPTRKKILEQFIGNTPHHEAFVGEEQLLKFVKVWLYLSNEDDCMFADLTKIMSGDVSELRTYMTQFASNEVTCLTGVNEVEKNGKKNYYQAIYNKAFARVTNKTPENLFNTALNEKYGEFKAIWGNSFKLKQFVQSASVDSPDIAEGNKNPLSDFTL